MIMGMSADDLFELSELEEEKPYLDAFVEANCKTYIFKCRAKLDVYEDQQRVRYQVIAASPLNYAAEAAKLVEQIKLYS
jgi:replication factor A1